MRVVGVEALQNSGYLQDPDNSFLRCLGRTIVRRLVREREVPNCPTAVLPFLILETCHSLHLEHSTGKGSQEN